MRKRDHDVVGEKHSQLVRIGRNPPTERTPHARKRDRDVEGEKPGQMLGIGGNPQPVGHLARAEGTATSQARNQAKLLESLGTPNRADTSRAQKGPRRSRREIRGRSPQPGGHLTRAKGTTTS